MHGKTLEDIKNNMQINKLIETKQIEKIIFFRKIIFSSKNKLNEYNTKNRKDKVYKNANN